MDKLLLVAFFIVTALFLYKVLGNKKDKSTSSKGYQGGEQKIDKDSEVK